MYLYKDIFSEDELFSDSFKISEVDGVVYRVESGFKTKNDDEDFGIGHNTDEDDEGGAGGDMGGSSSTVNELVDAFKLVEVQYDKKSYLAHLKKYMGQLKKHLEENHPDRVADFQKQVTEYARKVANRFKEYQFFQGESLHEDGMVVLQDFSEDGMTPYLYFFKDGVAQEKV